MSPLPFILAAVIGGASFLLGGPVAAGWTLVAWGSFVSLIALAR